MYGNRWGIAGPGGIQHHRLLDEACTGTQQSIELPAGFEFIQPTECRDHPLAHLITRAVAFHDLQEDCVPTAVCGQSPCVTRCGAHRLAQITASSMKNIVQTWHYKLRRMTTNQNEVKYLT